MAKMVQGCWSCYSTINLYIINGYSEDDYGQSGAEMVIKTCNGQDSGCSTGFNTETIQTGIYNFRMRCRSRNRDRCRVNVVKDVWGNSKCKTWVGNEEYITILIDRHGDCQYGTNPDRFPTRNEVD